MNETYAVAGAKEPPPQPLLPYVVQEQNALGERLAKLLSLVQSKRGEVDGAGPAGLNSGPATAGGPSNDAMRSQITSRFVGLSNLVSQLEEAASGLVAGL